MHNQKKIASQSQIATATKAYEDSEGIVERSVKILIAKGWSDGDISRALSVPHKAKTGNVIIPQWPNNIRKRYLNKK